MQARKVPRRWRSALIGFVSAAVVLGLVPGVLASGGEDSREPRVVSLPPPPTHSDEAAAPALPGHDEDSAAGGVALAGFIPPGFEVYSETAREDDPDSPPGDPVLFEQRLARGTVDDPSRASIGVLTIEGAFDLQAYLDTWDDGEVHTIQGKDAVIGHTVPDAPGEGLAVITFALDDEHTVMVIALGPVDQADLVQVAEGVKGVGR